MAFRRVILSGPKVKEVELDLKRFLDLSKTKIDFPGLKVDIKQGIKPDTLVVDINGEGADSFSKKVKDAGIKFQVQVAIKTEKPMDKKDIKEVIKKVLNEVKKYKEDSYNIKILSSKGISPEQLVWALDNEKSAELGIEDIQVKGVDFAKVRDKMDKKVLKEQKFTDAPEIKIIASSILDNQLSDEPYNLRNEEQVNYLAEEIWSALQKED